MVSFKLLVILSSFSALAWWISYGTLLFMWGDNMPKQTTGRDEKKMEKKMHQESATSFWSRSWIPEFTTRWDRQDVEQIKKNTPKSLQLNKWCAKTREDSLHDVVKAQCASLARLELGGPVPASSVPPSDNTSRVSTAGTASVSIGSSWREAGLSSIASIKRAQERKRRDERWGVMGPNKEQSDGATKSEPCQSHSCVAGPCSSEQPLIRVVFRGGISSQTF